MSDPQRKVVTLLPVPLLLLELHSERMIDVLLALQEAGFKVTAIKGHETRYRIDDVEVPSCLT